MIAADTLWRKTLRRSFLNHVIPPRAKFCFSKRGTSTKCEVGIALALIRLRRPFLFLASPQQVGGRVGKGAPYFLVWVRHPPFGSLCSPLSHAGRPPRSVTVRASNALTHVALRQQLSTVGRMQCTTPNKLGDNSVKTAATLRHASLCSAAQGDVLEAGQGDGFSTSLPVLAAGTAKTPPRYRLGCRGALTAHWAVEQNCAAPPPHRGGQDSWREKNHASSLRATIWQILLPSCLTTRTRGQEG